jgi:hypothetical protein
MRLVDGMGPVGVRIHAHASASLAAMLVCAASTWHDVPATCTGCLQSAGAVAAWWSAAGCDTCEDDDATARGSKAA